MTVSAVRKDPKTLTMTLEAEFDASPDRVWQLWADPRQLERWWGPPSYPATVAQEDLTPGGKGAYHMTGRRGEKHRGWWRIESVNRPTSLELTDGFADHDGKPMADRAISTMQME